MPWACPWHLPSRLPFQQLLVLAWPAAEGLVGLLVLLVGLLLVGVPRVLLVGVLRHLVLLVSGMRQLPMLLPLGIVWVRRRLLVPHGLVKWWGLLLRGLVR